MPDPLAHAHSQRLAARIRDEIHAAGGWIGFARFMELALYAPALGYYVAGSRKLGPDGDFVTAPEISALFGRALARQVAQVLESPGGAVLELFSGDVQFDLDSGWEVSGQMALGALRPYPVTILAVFCDVHISER